MNAAYRACCYFQAWYRTGFLFVPELFAINELPLPACCEPGFCPSAAIVSPHFTAMLYCTWLFFSGSLWHLSAHLVHAPSQLTRQQLLEHPAPSIICTGPAQSSLLAEIILSLLGGWRHSRTWLLGSSPAI